MATVVGISVADHTLAVADPHDVVDIDLGIGRDNGRPARRQAWYGSGRTVRIKRIARRIDREGVELVILIVDQLFPFARAGDPIVIFDSTGEHHLPRALLYPDQADLALTVAHIV